MTDSRDVEICRLQEEIRALQDQSRIADQHALSEAVQAATKFLQAEIKLLRIECVQLRAELAEYLAEDTMRTRDEHLEWAKKRARYYLEHGDVPSAIASMMSDLAEHEDFKGIAEKLTPLGLLYAMNHDYDGARRFIEGFR